MTKKRFGKSPSGTCVKCGVWRASLHHDHIVPSWRGGTDEESNIQFLCANCHEDKTGEERASLEYRSFQSTRMKTRMLSKRARQRIAKAVRKANATRVWTPDMKQRCSRKGIKRAPFTPEHRARISASKKGMKMTAAHKRAMSKAGRGKPWTETERIAHTKPWPIILTGDK